jgi:hypothetical protein
LKYIEDALISWEENHIFFLETAIREDFNIPKFHSLLHYIDSIRLFGATDNFNTEMFERLHIDFAKQGWRASNKRDEFPQMISWLSRQEKIVPLKAISLFLKIKIPLKMNKIRCTTLLLGLLLSPNIPTISTNPFLTFQDHTAHPLLNDTLKNT